MSTGGKLHEHDHRPDPWYGLLSVAGAGARGSPWMCGRTCSRSAWCSYEMLTGARPFDRGSLAGTLSAILRDAPVSGAKAPPADPRDVSRLIERSLEKDREKRFASAGEFLQALLVCHGLHSRWRRARVFCGVQGSRRRSWWGWRWHSGRRRLFGKSRLAVHPARAGDRAAQVNPSVTALLQRRRRTGESDRNERSRRPGGARLHPRLPRRHIGDHNAGGRGGGH